MAMINNKLELAKERLRLQIKIQEYEIKKNLLDLKEDYSPLNYVAGVAGNFLKSATADKEEQIEQLQSNLNKFVPKNHQNKFIDLLLYVVIFLEKWLKQEDGPVDKTNLESPLTTAEEIKTN